MLILLNNFLIQLALHPVFRKSNVFHHFAKTSDEFSTEFLDNLNWHIVILTFLFEVHQMHLFGRLLQERKECLEFDVVRLSNVENLIEVLDCKRGHKRDSSGNSCVIRRTHTFVAWMGLVLCFIAQNVLVLLQLEIFNRLVLDLSLVFD